MNDTQMTILTVIILVIITICGIIFIYYFVTVPDSQALKKFNDEVAQDINESKLEKIRLETISCHDLKSAISDHEFTQESDSAVQKYIGMCT